MKTFWDAYMFWSHLHEILNFLKMGFPQIFSRFLHELSLDSPQCAFDNCTWFRFQIRSDQIRSDNLYSAQCTCIYTHPLLVRVYVSSLSINATSNPFYPTSNAQHNLWFELVPTTFKWLTGWFNTSIEKGWKIPKEVKWKALDSLQLTSHVFNSSK